MQHVPHFNRWSGPLHDSTKAARHRAIGNINLFVVPSL